MTLTICASRFTYVEHWPQDENEQSEEENLEYHQVESA